jgi:glycerol-3-phosphate acyltransferase PlsY
MEYLLAIIGGYLLGSVPFGLVLTRFAGYGDIRAIGSGNIGATNVLRTGNKKLALATLLLDSLKGAAAVLLAAYLMNHFYLDCSGEVMTGDTSRCQSPFTFETVPLVAGLSALLGHLFPIWLKFRGGKGVATALGTLIALQPIIGLSACGLWLLTAAVTRYSSLSALVAIAATPFIAHFIYNDANLTGLCGIVATLVFFKHRANIHRLLKGEEPKIGKKN